MPLSTPANSIPSTHRDRSHWLFWSILIGSFAFSLLGWAYTRHSLQQANEQRFHRQSDRLATAIENRLHAVGDMLYAARGLTLSRHELTPAEWSAYLRSLTPRLTRGVTGIGLIKRVPRTEATAFETAIQSQGYPQYKLEQLGDYPWHYAVVVIEPAETNTGVAGLDIATGGKRRQAAEAAARDNTLILSRRIRLNFNNREVPGSLLFLPFYRSGAALDTPAQRLDALQGWIYASLRIDLLMENVSNAASTSQLDFELFEGHADPLTLTDLLHDDDAHLGPASTRALSAGDYTGRSFTTTRSLTIHGQPWTLRLSTRPEFDKLSNLALPWYVLMGGITLGLFSAALIRASSQARRQAVELAAQMTVDLRRSEAEAHKLALVASLTTNIVVLTDADWRITWINDGFSRMLGYTSAEVLGQRPNDFLRSPRTNRQTLLAMVRAGRAGLSFRSELILLTKAGEDLWVDMELQPVRDARGNITSYLSVQQDITARKHAAAELLAAKEAAERANIAKSSFLAMMSHEIRTPMNGVIGMTSLLLDSPLTPEQREYAETIRLSGDSLLVIINDILDFSKIESGRLELEQLDFSIRECVEGALDLLANRAAEKKIDLLYEIDDGTPGLIRGDPTRLRQIVVNLLGNAIKFTEQGEVCLSVRAQSTGPGRVRLELAVRDTGIGISLEAQAKLFQSFTQVDASTTRKFGGTGLGLAISKRLVELMGGRLWVESRPGEGSTFLFSLEATVVAAKPRLYVSEHPVELSGRRLLLIDDNLTNLRILSSLTSQWGMHVQTVTSAQAALALLQGGAVIDAAIVDMHMPDMDGAMFASALRGALGARTPPLILLSSLGQREGITDRQLFNYYLTKPAKPAQIHHALTQLLGPTTTTAATPVLPAPPSRSATQQERVLLAEDNSVNQRVALLMLTRLGYRADLAADGQEVLAAVQRQPYDIILMDVQMPNLDGIEATRQLIAKYPDPDKRPWIIALTAGAMEGDRELCLHVGMNDYITKPIKSVDLGAALARARLRAARS